MKRKKPTQLGVLIEAGVIEDGAVLRYMKVQVSLNMALRVSLHVVGSHENCSAELEAWL